MKFDPIHYFFVISAALAVAAGFVFFWHRWSRTRTPLSLIIAIAITVAVAVILAFSTASLIITLLDL